MAEVATISADLDGSLSPPRDNGEIVFAAPWERRVFGLAVTLCRSPRFEWEGFRQRLIARIEQDPARPYWRSWAAALEDVVVERGAASSAELDDRRRALAARPASHDH